ncbi:MAG: leucine-rich repeat protein [Oscillospiraceae bacterium]|nr:leucine-rich repeat protein [Oscillospiraceae bacterium]
MKKTILSFFSLALVIALMLSACKNDTPEGNSSLNNSIAFNEISSADNNEISSVVNNENNSKSSSDTTDRTDTSSQISGSSFTSTSVSSEKNVTSVKNCEHIWSQWQETTKATCYSLGKQTRICSACSKEENKVLEKVSHKESGWIVDKASTVEKEGKKHIECVYCKKVIKEEVIPKTNKNHEHVGAYYSVTKQPTCANEGRKELICSCGTTIKTEVISALEHTIVTDPAVSATCSKTGLTEGKHCSVCKAIIVQQTVVPQKEHAYGPWTLFIQAKETTTGIKRKTCTVCAVSITETIPAIKDSDPSELNIIYYELRDDGYWVTAIQSCTNPVLVIPATYQGKAVVGISEKAFSNNSVLEEVVIPNSVKNCEYRAFYKCGSLKKVTMSENMETIAQGMFEGCSQLTEINLPKSIKSIGSKAFSSCTKLNLGTFTLNCPIGENSFYGVRFDTLTVKTKTITIGLGHCRINKLILAEGVETIHKQALSGATIGEISFPTTLKTIKNNSFYGTTVEKIDLKSAVHLDYGAFNGCRMKEIVIPSGSTFDRCVFMNCERLETVYFGGTRAEWGLLIQGYGYTNEDYQIFAKINVICADE